MIETKVNTGRTLRELNERKMEIEDWFWNFPESPNESFMRNEYLIILAEIEELEKPDDYG